MFVTTFAFFGAMCLGAIELQLAPGSTDRSGLPCFLPVESSWNLKSGNTGTMIDASGNIWASWQAIPSRLSSSGNNRSLEIVFVPPAFSAGKPQKLILDLGKTPATGLVWDTDPDGMARLTHNKKPLAVYFAPKYDASNAKTLEATYKVFHHLFDPQTGTRLTKGSGGQFTHHRGIFYGFMKVTYGTNQVVDIWHCKNETHQSAMNVLLQEAGPVAGLQRVTIGWQGRNLAGTGGALWVPVCLMGLVRPSGFQALVRAVLGPLVPPVHRLVRVGRWPARRHRVLPTQETWRRPDLPQWADWRAAVLAWG